MESNLPGIKVFLACKSESMYLLEGEERILSKDELQLQKKEFAYIREINCDMQSHPIEDLMKESQLPCGPIISSMNSKKTECVLLTNANLPTRSLNGDQIKKAISIIKKECGKEPKINSSIVSADWVVGVENEELFQAPLKDKNVTLIATGLGHNLFKSMFPSADVMVLG